MRRKPLIRTIKVDEETYLVVKDMQESLREWGLKKPTMCESLVTLLCHRQTGSWMQRVERARENRARRAGAIFKE